MKELVDVFADNNVLVLGIVIFIFGLILLGVLLTLILSKKNNKNVVKIEEKNVIDKKDDLKEEIKENINEEVKIDEIKEEVIDEIKNDEIDDKISNELEEMLNKMQKTLDEKEEIDNIADFEREQEENAIISYQELLKAAKKDFPQMNLEPKKEEVKNVSKEEVATTITKDDTIKSLFNEEKDEITLDSDYSVKTDLMNNYSIKEDKIISNIEESVIEKDELYDSMNEYKSLYNTSEDKKFKNSIFISPIGITNNEVPNYYKEVRVRRDYLKEMADSKFSYVDIQTEDLDFNKKENEQFLEDLKSFRSNL